MMKFVLSLTAIVLAVLDMPSRADAYGAAHVGYTHVGPNGVYHTGTSAAYGPGGAYAGGHSTAVGGGGAYHEGYHYGTGGSSAGSGYDGVHYCPSISGTSTYHAGGYSYTYH